MFRKKDFAKKAEQVKLFPSRIFRRKFRKERMFVLNNKCNLTP
jgi:hypothetical protein